MKLCCCSKYRVSPKVAKILLLALGAAVIMYAFPIFADGCTGEECGFKLGGTDKSSDLQAFSNIAKTIQVFAMKYAAPLMGSILVFFGIVKIATRQTMVGVVAALGGSALLFLPNLIAQLAKLGGT